MKTIEQLKKEIETEFEWFKKNNGVDPNIAYVKVKWFDEDEAEDLTQTIAIENDWQNKLIECDGEEYVVPFIKDEEVLYYCSGIESLIDLCEDNGTSDFKVVEFSGFEYLENN